MRHRDDLAAAEEQEDQQQVQVEPGVERGGEDEVVPSPQLVAVAVRPEHDDEAADEAGEVARGDVAVEDGGAAAEDGRVPQVELGTGEEAVEKIDDGRRPGAEEERVRDRFPLLLLEELGRALCWLGASVFFARHFLHGIFSLGISRSAIFARHPNFFLRVRGLQDWYSQLRRTAHLVSGSQLTTDLSRCALGPQSHRSSNHAWY